jgi:ABC-type dipeptide/oligopeptide/nickel transport system permease component
MNNSAAINRSERLRVRDRLAAAFLLLIMGAACLSFWIAVPVGVLWALSKATGSFVTHFTLGLVLVPMAMVAFSPVLFWLNALYLRVTGVLARLEADQREAGWSRRIGGPLEPLLIASLVIALIAFAVWFFFYAEDPLVRI